MTALFSGCIIRHEVIRRKNGLARDGHRFSESQMCRIRQRRKNYKPPVRESHSSMPIRNPGSVLVNRNSNQSNGRTHIRDVFGATDVQS